MSSPNSRTYQFDGMFTSTFTNRRSEVIDQFLNETVFLNALKRNKSIKFDGSGGTYLEVPLSYAKNNTVKSFGRGDVFALNENEFMSMAQYQWKFVGVNVSRYYDDEAKNKSKQQIINYVQAKVDNAITSMADSIETMLFADGTGNSSKDTDGLANLVASDPTTSTTVGGINQATYSWWRNVKKAAGGAAATYLRGDMTHVYNSCSKGTGVGHPNLIITDQSSWELYYTELDDRQRFIGKAADGDVLGEIGFMGKPVLWATQCPANTMYFLNTKHISLIIDPDLSWILTDWKSVANNLDRHAQYTAKLNLVATRRASQGYLVVQP